MFPFPIEKIKLKASLEIPLGAVFEYIRPLLTPERISKIHKVASERNFNNAIVLENIYDRGNASAVMRSAEAMGFVNIHMIEIGEKFKESQRTTAGADKWIELTKWKTTAECVQALKKQGKKILVTHLSSKSKPLSEIDFSAPTALVLGNEKEGASPEMVGLADEVVLLPMTGFVQSYNISVAGALCFYQIFQDRLRRLGRNSDVSVRQIERLEAEYYLRTQDSAENILLEKVQKK